MPNYCDTKWLCQTCAVLDGVFLGFTAFGWHLHVNYSWPWFYCSVGVSTVWGDLLVCLDQAAGKFNILGTNWAFGMPGVQHIARKAMNCNKNRCVTQHCSYKNWVENMLSNAIGAALIHSRYSNTEFVTCSTARGSKYRGWEKLHSDKWNNNHKAW